MTKIEFYYQKITVVEFRAFDQFHDKHFYDSEPDQIAEFIFKKICPTAEIIKMTEYPITERKQVNGYKKRL